MAVLAALIGNSRGLFSITSWDRLVCLCGVNDCTEDEDIVLLMSCTAITQRPVCQVASKCMHAREQFAQLDSLHHLQCPQAHCWLGEAQTGLMCIRAWPLDSKAVMTER